MALATCIHAKEGHVLYEWPTGCRLWRSKRVLKMVKNLGMTKANINGCSLGLVSSRGNPMFKPWTLASSFEMFGRAFCGLVCDKTHTHDHARGSETAKTSFTQRKWREWYIM